MLFDFIKILLILKFLENVFDDIEEIAGLDDLLPSNKNTNLKSKNESDFDI